MEKIIEGFCGFVADHGAIKRAEAIPAGKFDEKCDLYKEFRNDAIELSKNGEVTVTYMITMDAETGNVLGYQKTTSEGQVTVDKFVQVNG